MIHPGSAVQLGNFWKLPNTSYTNAEPLSSQAADAVASLV